MSDKPNLVNTWQGAKVGKMWAFQTFFVEKVCYLKNSLKTNFLSLRVFLLKEKALVTTKTFCAVKVKKYFFETWQNAFKFSFVA